MWIEFRGAAGEIQRLERQLAKIVDDQLDGLGRHHLCALGTGRDVAVQTLLVAAVTQVDL